MGVERTAVHCLDWGLWRQSFLPALLGKPMSVTTGVLPIAQGGAYVGWGLKRSGLRAQRLAARHDRPCWLLEDGFVRSVGGSDSQSWSLVIDDEGIYYDARRPSRLERLIARPLDKDQTDRARRLVQSWRQGRISKYNYAPDVELSTLPERYVLVVDQTRGDQSISAGLADANTFQIMLDAALAQHPDCDVILKVHPEVAAGRKSGHYDIAALSARPRVRIVSTECHPATLIAQAEAVYTVTSQVGFEALLWGKAVYTYGMPFYASWGHTHDHLAPLARRTPVPLEQLVYAALIEYPRYLDPETHQPCSVETVIAWVTLQRQQRARFAPELLAYGFSRWKRNFVREFLAGSNVTFTDSLPPPSRESRPLVTWGHKHTEALQQHGYAQHDVLRIEDGFIRSVGLGAELIRPLSWVVDRTGIYYDAQQPSDLEHILATADFDEKLIARANTLRSTLVKLGITKYNLQHQNRWRRPSNLKHVILVPGQVETDAAIKYATTQISRNIDLLKAVRQQNPEAWVIYKPHPDVLARLRDQGDGEDQAQQWCNEVVTDVPIDTLLAQVDEVHVLTSLAGFEALLRNVPVTTWGQPFYAGWGLTVDKHLAPATAARRTRILTLDQLVAGALILYPTYVSRTTRQFCTVERALSELLNWRQESRPNPARRVIAQIFRKP